MSPTEAAGKIDYELRRTDYRVAKAVFYLFFLAFLLFPNDDEFRSLGVGSEGSRVLFLDIFVLMIILAMASGYGEAVRRLTKRIGAFPLALFLLMYILSMIRGLPTFGGYAIGEGRWYASIVMMPAAYVIYDDEFGLWLKRIIVVAALWHCVFILFSVYSGSPWDIRGEVLRYATGRESLIVAIASVIVIGEIAAGGRPRLPRVGMLLFFVVVILIAQTRTVFVALPLAYAFSILTSGKVRVLRLAKITAAIFICTAVLWISVRSVLPEGLAKSVETSYEVVLESISPGTIGMLASGDITSDSRNLGLSASGNTTFRLLAWAQVIQSVEDVSGGRWIGAPMGSGFFFYDASGASYENLDPHNDYISIWSKVGWIGLIGYALILGSFVMAAQQISRLLRPRLQRNSLQTLMPIFWLLVIFVGFNAEIRSYGSHFWMWSLIGFGFKCFDGVAPARRSKSKTPAVAS